MTTKTSDFSGLLFYNPAANGFNPVVSATIHCPDNMNEYDSILVNVVTWNLPDQNLFWRVAPYGTNLTLGRFTLGSSDSTPLVSNRASFTIAVSADNTTSVDGQSFDIIVSKTLNGPALATKYGVNVNDTSQTPPSITYTLTSDGSVDEGGGLTFTASGTNVPNGTYYWTIETNSGDFAVTSGSLGINDNYGSFIVGPNADATTEGSETFTVALRSGSVSGPIVVTSAAITINDTSQTPSGPTYEIIPSATAMDEGGTGITFTINTTGLADNAQVIWWIDGIGSVVDPSWTTRFVEGVNNGTVTIISNTASFTLTASTNGTTGDGAIFSIWVAGTLFQGQANSGNITINDVAPAPQSFVFNGSTDYKYIFDALSDWDFSVTDNFTVEFWSKAASSSASSIFTVLCQGPQNGIDVFYDSGHLRMFDGHDDYISWVEPTPGVWTHVAIMNAGGLIYAFYNGVRQTITSGAWVPGYHWGNGIDPLAIGKRGGVGGQNFNGKLTGIRITGNVQYIDIMNVQNFYPYSQALPPTKVVGTKLLLNPTASAMLDDLSDSNHSFGPGNVGQSADYPGLVTYTHQYGTEAPPDFTSANLVWNLVIPQSLVGWTMTGLDVPPGTTVLTQSSTSSQTFMTISNEINYHAVNYTFIAP